MSHISLFLGTLNGGGAERMVVHLANGLAQYKEHKVDLLVANAVGPYVTEVEDEVNLIDLRSSYGVKGCLFQLVKYLNNVNPVSILTTQVHSSIVVAIAAKLSTSNTKLCIREANTPGPYFKGLGKSGKIKKYLLKLVYPSVDTIIAVSKGVKEGLCDFYSVSEEKIEVIYNPVIDDRFFDMAKHDFPTHKWIENGDKVIVGMGRIAPQKDFKTLLRAFKCLQENTSCKLIILGKANDRDYLSEITELIEELGIGDNVDMPGFIQNPFPIIANSSVFVLSSRHEGLPGVLIQALGCGCPVVSTDCPSGPKEILEDGKFGTLVPIGDYKKMSTAILDTLKNNNIDRSKLINRSLAFNKEKSIRKYMNVLL